MRSVPHCRCGPALLRGVGPGLPQHPRRPSQPPVGGCGSLHCQVLPTRAHGPQLGAARQQRRQQEDPPQDPHDALRLWVKAADPHPQPQRDGGPAGGGCLGAVLRSQHLRTACSCVHVGRQRPRLPWAWRGGRGAAHPGGGGRRAGQPGRAAGLVRLPPHCGCDFLRPGVPMGQHWDGDVRGGALDPQQRAKAGERRPRGVVRLRGALWEPPLHCAGLQQCGIVL
mmetsp:Transcript_9045/g.25981  ORF Transcript_9045/g.25981 Transcript_9045/m.25981 type:complete len:225 (-) Transcript_9045:1572-2246(-)